MFLNDNDLYTSILNSNKDLFFNIETEKLNNKYSNAVKIKKYQKLKKKFIYFLLIIT